MKTVGAGILGCGTIGSMLAKAIVKGMVPNAHVVVLFDEFQDVSTRLAEALGTSPIVAKDFTEILQNSDVNLVIEASAQEAAKKYVPIALESGKDVMMMSVGAFADLKFQREVESFSTKGSKVYLPSGAIGGVDAVKAGSVGGLTSATLITRKPPAALSGAPGAEGKNLKALTTPLEIFSGSAREAVGLFPANVNVAATLSLAGLGFERTVVKIIADPSINRNIHEIVVEGRFGRFTGMIENEPSPENPKTSYMAGLSAIRRLVDITGSINVGT